MNKNDYYSSSISIFRQKGACRYNSFPIMAAKPLYRISFLNQGKVYEIYARGVSQGAMFGFVEVDGMEFGKRTSLVVDPGEEKIKSEFSGVRRTYIPMHCVLRIDEVEKRGVSKISSAEEGNVTQFPAPVYAPGGAGSD